jgi:hypothetical protein
MEDYLPHHVVYVSLGLVEQKDHLVVVLHHTINRMIRAVHLIKMAHHLIISLRNAACHRPEIKAGGMVIHRLETYRLYLEIVLVDRLRSPERSYHWFLEPRERSPHTS